MESWWIVYVPLLIFPILLLMITLGLSIVVAAELAPAFFIVGIVMGLFAGFLEETGWTGFVFPRMSVKGNILSASLALGVVHTIWHIFPDYLGNFNTLEGYWLPYIIGFLLHIIPLRILIVWVYTNTNSLWLAILMHASSTGFFGFFISNSISPEHRAIIYLVYGFVIWIPAVAVIWKYGKTLNSSAAMNIPQ